jgi:hypothetical protein
LAYIFEFEDMAFGQSNSAIAVALWWVAGGCCLLPQRAAAGDKIEFSVPAFVGGVPQREIEPKDSKTPAPAPRASPYDLGVYYQAPESSTIIVTGPRGMDRHKWDSRFSPEGGRRDLGGFDGESRTDGTEGLTNNPSRLGNGNPSGSLGPGRNAESLETSADLAYRSDALRSFGRNDDRERQPFADRQSADRYFDSRQGPAWMQGSDDHGFFGMDWMRHGEFQPDQFRNPYEQQSAVGAAGAFHGGVDSPQTPALPPSTIGSSFLGSSVPEGGGDGLFGTPARAWDSGASALPGARSDSGGDQLWSGGGQRQAPTAPAVLPLPRKPWDVFQQ